MINSPPSPTEFNDQVIALIKQYGESAFCSSSGQLPDFTLFVEDQTVIAEPRNAPRHPYGLFCTINPQSSETQVNEHIHKWLESGEAYKEFMVMNVCRYNC